ncbi:MAG: hypothetical protein CL878_06940 [Dehalococcoidia bacterium]|nr:hypothetical protein [Dehalococcoidia bacterium]
MDHTGSNPVLGTKASNVLLAAPREVVNMPRRTPQRRERRRPKKASASSKAQRVVEALEPTPMVEVIRKRRRKRGRNVEGDEASLDQ